VGIGESQGKQHLAQTNERSSPVTEGNDGSWVPETSDGAQGALTRLMGQGLQHTTACRRAISATVYCGENVARLMRCPEAARLNWTVREQTRETVSAKLPPYP